MMILPSIAWLYWDPSRTLFTIPYINHPVGWYGLFFAFGFLLAFIVIHYLIKQILTIRQKLLPPSQNINHLTSIILNKLTWYVVIGTVLGARLGHVFFYDWPYYQNHLGEIFWVGNGGIAGLASHGGAVGIFCALLLCYRKIKTLIPLFSFLSLMDILCIGSSLTAFSIRIGNFFNQEIIGITSMKPWAVIFGHPASGGDIVPRHPTQLYEALSYLLTFVILFNLWKLKRISNSPGFTSGLFFILIFSSRFFIEFLKVPQSMLIHEDFLQMGQYLSSPFILIGFGLILYSFKTHKKETIKLSKVFL